MKTTVTEIGGRKIWCEFKSRYQAQNDYMVGLCCRPDGMQDDCRVNYTDEGKKSAPFCSDAGLTETECFAAVDAYKAERHAEFLEWEKRQSVLVAK